MIYSEHLSNITRVPCPNSSAYQRSEGSFQIDKLHCFLLSLTKTGSAGSQVLLSLLNVSRFVKKSFICLSDACSFASATKVSMLPSSIAAAIASLTAARSSGYLLQHRWKIRLHRTERLPRSQDPDSFSDSFQLRQSRYMLHPSCRKKL